MHKLSCYSVCSAGVGAVYTPPIEHARLYFNTSLMELTLKTEQASKEQDTADVTPPVPVCSHFDNYDVLLEVVDCITNTNEGVAGANNTGRAR